MKEWYDFKKAEFNLIMWFMEAMRLIDTPTDFENACKTAHEVRE